MSNVRATRGAYKHQDRDDYADWQEGYESETGREWDDDLILATVKTIQFAMKGVRAA